MTMHWPQIVYLLLTILGLGIAIGKHGQPREPWSFPQTLVSTVVCLGLLYAGGFFG